MKTIISSIFKKHKNGLIQIIFLGDAIDRLLNSGYNPSDVDILTQSFETLNKDILILCENEEIHVFPYLNDENKNEQIELLKKEHLQLFDRFRYVQSLVGLVSNSSFDRYQLLDLKLAVKSLSNYISAHLRSENELLAEATKQTIFKKHQRNFPSERKV